MGMFGSLRHRDFALFWIGAVISSSGSTMQSVVVPFAVFALTRSTTWLGLSAAVAFVPNVLVGPLGGALADRHSRRTILLVTQGLGLLSALGLWLLWASGSATVGSLLGVLLLGSLAGGVSISSWQAYVPSLVPRRDLMNAVRLNSIQFNVARAAGPLLATLLLTTLGPGAAFLGNALSFIPVLGVLVVLPSTAPARSSAGTSMAQEFAEGLRYVRRHRSIVECVASNFVMATLVYSVVQLAPAVANDQLDVGKAGYGLLVTAYGLGSIVTSFVLASQADRFRRSLAAAGAFALGTVALVVLGFSRSFGLAAFAMVLVGIAQTVAGITFMSTIQIQVDDSVRGRVISVYLMAIQLAIPLGALVEGVLASTTGTSPVLVVAGGLLFAYFITAMVKFRGMGELNLNGALEGEGGLRMAPAD
jgi:MFS family permease